MVDQGTPVKTPVKVLQFLSPSASKICLVCQTDASNTCKNRWSKLFTNEGVLSTAGETVETTFEPSIKLEKTTDYQVICRNCWRQIQTLFKKKHDIIKRITDGRQSSKKFVRTRFKRGMKSSQESTSRKKLTYSSGANNDESSFQFDDGERICQNLVATSQDKQFRIPVKFGHQVLAIMSTGKTVEVFKSLIRNFPDEAKEVIESHVTKVLKQEAKGLCSISSQSVFKLSDFEVAESLQSQEEELIAKAPLTLAFAKAIALNPRKGRSKSVENCMPPILTAISTLLYTRNYQMNTNAYINSIILRRGQAKKITFDRLHKIGLCLSYSNVMTKLGNIGKDFDAPVKEWMKSVSEDDKDFKEIITEELMSPQGLPMQLSTSTPQADPPPSTLCGKFGDLSISKNNYEFLKFMLKKFMLVGDNVDKKIKRRHYAIERSNKDLHLFNLIAVENRIPIPTELLLEPPPYFVNGDDICFDAILPNPGDDEKLREEFMILISRDLLKYCEELKWMEPFVVRSIPHKYDDLVKKKSNIIPLGIINKNENTSEGILEILRHQHGYVPSHDDTLIRTFTVGDLLTVERSQNAQIDVLDHPTAEQRLEGLIPALADFHTYGNFLEVIWHILYDTASAGDIGTLYQARTFLNARSVPKDPMSDVNACEELLVKFSEALIVSAYKSLNTKFVDKGDPKKNEDSTKELLTLMVDQFLLQKKTDEMDCSLSCPVCQKCFKKVKHVRKHMYKKKHFAPAPGSDFVLNYSKNALALCFLAKDLIDARKRGDGERMLRLYKYCLLYFKLDGRHKYSGQTLHLLAQVNFLLPPALAHELTWNRFTNNKGYSDSNVELDRELEHLNKYVKMELKSFQGKITDKSIIRCSQSYSIIQKIISNFDTQTKVNPPSGKHTSIDWRDDVLKLVEQFQREKLFCYQDGRYHRQFPSFPRNHLVLLNIKVFKDDAKKKINKYMKMNIYKHRGISIENK